MTNCGKNLDRKCSHKVCSSTIRLNICCWFDKEARRAIKREAFKHKDGFVILENVMISVCDNCGNRYYCTDILHAVHAIATGAKSPERTEQIPVDHLESA